MNLGTMTSFLAIACLENAKEKKVTATRTGPFQHSWCQVTFILLGYWLFMFLSGTVRPQRSIAIDQG